jgi:hypothetical protein
MRGFDKTEMALRPAPKRRARSGGTYADQFEETIGLTGIPGPIFCRLPAMT